MSLPQVAAWCGRDVVIVTSYKFVFAIWPVLSLHLHLLLSQACLNKIKRLQHCVILNSFTINKPNSNDIERITNIVVIVVVQVFAILFFFCLYFTLRISPVSWVQFTIISTNIHQQPDPIRSNYFSRWSLSQLVNRVVKKICSRGEKSPRRVVSSCKNGIRNYLQNFIWVEF